MSAGGKVDEKDVLSMHTLGLNHARRTQEDGMTEEELNRIEALAKAAKNGSLQDDDNLYMACGPATIISLIALARKGLVADRLSQYAEHDSDCVLAKWSAGRPTDDGGYEMKFAGVWYKARPVDESPPCECGLSDILSALPKPGGE